MSSQLNPDAAEFVPVSPTRLLMLDDAIISASSFDNSNISMDDVVLPTEQDFGMEIKQRPGDMEFTNGPKHVDYFMRDNFSTLPNKVKDFKIPTTCASVDSSILSFKPSSNNGPLENIPFDQLEVVKNIEEDKENILAMNDFSNNFGAAGIFGKGDPMTTSVVGFPSSPEPEGEDGIVPGTPKSTSVEAPVSPSSDDLLPLNHQEHLDEAPQEELGLNENKSLEPLSFDEGPQDDHKSAQEERISSGFEPENGVEDNVPEDNDGYVTEHRRSPPIDLSFKPIQNFSDTNPFGALQTPGSTSTPMALNDIAFGVNQTEQPVETNDNITTIDKFPDNFDLAQNTPTSFISLRSPAVKDVPAFDKLESPTEELRFEPSPSANSSILDSELQNSHEDETHTQETIQELVETNQLNSKEQESVPELKNEESKILEEENEPKIHETTLVDNEIVTSTSNPVESEKEISSFDNFEPHEDKKESDFECEIKEMKLEFESHIVTADLTVPNINSPEEIKSGDEEFEVITKEEVNNVIPSQNEPIMSIITESEELLSPSRQTNPFASSDDFSEKLLDAQTEDAPKNDFLSAIHKFDSVVEDELCKIKETVVLSSPTEFVPLVEPEATQTVSYQTLTPADEPKLGKTEIYSTEIVENSVERVIEPQEDLQSETHSPIVVNEPPVSVIEPVESQVVLETVITAVQEKSEEGQSVAIAEAFSSTETPPPTPAPGLEVIDEAQKTDIFVAAVAAAGVVATGAALVADKEVKKATSAGVKKPAATTAKKPEAASKSTAKPAPAKAPAAKPAPAKTTTTKPAGTSSATKPATGTTKAPAAKPTSAPAAAKKPTLASSTKPAPAKPATLAAPKPTTTTTTTSPKPVPKQLPVNKTTATTLKSTSKPTTPTSKPTTPTTPKSPSVMKTDVVKSPPRAAVKSTLATSRPSSAPSKPSVIGDKKPLMNGDVKSAAKKPEEATKKPATSTARPTTTTRPAVPATKASAPLTKAPTAAAAKTAPSKPTTTSQPKPKTPTTTTAPKTTVPPPIKRPTSAPVTKPGEKIAPKAASNVKPAVNGKAAPAKPTAGVKKTDAKVNGKAAPGKPVPKKADEIKVEEQEIKIQEHSVTTTNGFAEHVIEENGIMKIEELSPVLVDGVN